MQNFEKGHFLYKSQKKIFFFMGDESPNAHDPWLDLFHLLNSRHYSHPKFKIVKIEVNFWEGPTQLF